MPRFVALYTFETEDAPLLNTLIMDAPSDRAAEINALLQLDPNNTGTKRLIACLTPAELRELATAAETFPADNAGS